VLGRPRLTSPHLDLKPSEFREIPDKPLGRVRDLLLGLAFFTSGAVGVIAVALWRDNPLLAYFSIPVAMWAGIFLAGLLPRAFFRNSGPARGQPDPGQR
jgi:hypothetical protein